MSNSLEERSKQTALIHTETLLLYNGDNAGLEGGQGQFGMSDCVCRLRASQQVLFRTHFKKLN